jgi:biopolymer transport protein ExbD
MRIRQRAALDEPDINFIPLIDVLLVIVIFLAVSTTFAQERVLEVLLPQAQTDAPAPNAISLTIDPEGRMAVNDRLLPQSTLRAVAEALRQQAAGQDVSLIIRADGNASHQSVVTAMQAARQAGIDKLGFAAQVTD